METLFSDLFRHDYIRKHLKFCGRLKTSSEKKAMKRFLRGYLKSDGIFIVKMLSKNTSSVFVSDLVQGLFNLYIHKSKSFDSAYYEEEKNTNPQAGNQCGDCFALSPVEQRGSPPALPPKTMHVKRTDKPKNYMAMPLPPAGHLLGNDPPFPNAPDISCSGLTLGRDSDNGTILMQRRITSTEQLAIKEQPGHQPYEMDENRNRDPSMINIMPPNYTMAATFNNKS